MHTKRCKKLSINICEQAVEACFRNKWRRRDVLSFIEKYAGIPRAEIEIEELTGERTARNEAITSCALALYEVLTQIIAGQDPEDVDPVLVRPRPDGMTGKMRDIALLCIMHQLIGHTAKLMLDPLFDARLLPTQHASLPDRGQTRLKDQIHRYFLREGLGIRYVRKTDVVHAYQSTKYEIVLGLIKSELPKAHELHAIIAYLGRIAPGGHLIIGGYLDAWLFNYAMSYALRHLYQQGTERRGKFVPYIIRCDTFMDDFGHLARSIKGLERATRDLDIWMQQVLGLRLKYTTGVTKLLPIEEETKRRAEPHGKARRGCPALDMAGFKICRTHVTIRPRVFIRARRQFLRGWDELQRTGTLRRVRADKLIAYNGYVEQTDSCYIREQYHIEALMVVAARVSGFYRRQEHKKRMEALYDLQKCRSRRKACEGRPRKSSGEDPRATDRQRDNLPDGRRDPPGDVPF